MSESLQPYDQIFATPWPAASQSCLSFTMSQSLLKLMSIELVMPSKHLILCLSLLILLLTFPSIKVFFNKSVLHVRWPKYWSFRFSISPSNEQSRLISFRIDWFDPLAVQRTIKSLLQHYKLKASILLQKKQELQYHSLKHENNNHRKLTKMNTWITACVTQGSYEPCCARPPKMVGSWWRVLTKHGSLQIGMQTTSIFLPQEPHEQYKRLMYDKIHYNIKK